MIERPAYPPMFCSQTKYFDYPNTIVEINFAAVAVALNKARKKGWANQTRHVTGAVLRARIIVAQLYAAFAPSPYSEGRCRL
jgi:hypothetical protein